MKNLLNFNAVCFQLNTTIIQQQNVARNNIFQQFFVVDTDLFLCTFTLPSSASSNEFVADVQQNLVVFERGNAYFRALATKIAKFGGRTSQPVHEYVSRERYGLQLFRENRSCEPCW